MSRKKIYYLDFYYKCMENLELPRRGLCEIFPEVSLWFKPTDTEFGDESPEQFFWAYDGTNDKIENKIDADFAYEFTPLRQTIVLFLAAMNNEL